MKLMITNRKKDEEDGDENDNVHDVGFDREKTMMMLILRKMHLMVTICMMNKNYGDDDEDDNEDEDEDEDEDQDEDHELLQIAQIICARKTCSPRAEMDEIVPTWRQ